MRRSVHRSKRGRRAAAAADTRAGERWTSKLMSGRVPRGRRRQEKEAAKAASSLGSEETYFLRAFAADACLAAALTCSVFAANFWRNFSTRPVSTMRVWAPV